MRHLLILIAAGLVVLALFTTAAAQTPADARQTARQQLTEAQKAVSDGEAAVAKAEQALEGTQGEERKTAERLLAQAQEKLTAARRELARRNTEALNAAAQPAIIGRPGRSPALAEREHADPMDSSERFALLAPGGPVVVEVALTIDGQPFRMAREKLIDEMLAAADKDGDGQVRWEEALAAPRFTLGQFGVANAQARLKDFWDKNSDGLVDRAEVRHFLAQRFQGPAFSIGGVPNAYGRSGRVVVNGQLLAAYGVLPDVVRLIDADQDGTLNAAEIAAAGERLKSRDADDNDLLFPAELGGVPDVNAMPANLRLPQPDPQPAVLLGPTLTADSLFTALCVRYKVESGPITADRFPAVPALFAALDDDGDGKLQKFEAIGINDVEPQIAIAVDLSATGSGKGLSITSLAPEVAEATKAAGGDALALPGVRITMTAQASATPTVNYDAVAASYISRLDKDGNAYLEKSEAGDQFALWDGDGDGKVYAKEIAAAFAVMTAPQATRVVANVNYLGNSLFQLLDQDGDGRLGAREMRDATERTRSLDKDASGSITADEIPATISVSFGLGNAGYGVVQREGGTATAAAGGPEWFQRMDRNLDGDLSLREFLGDEQDFRRLDENGDGLIDPREAETAGGGR